jgi:hypothetical protein
VALGVDANEQWLFISDGSMIRHRMASAVPENGEELPPDHGPSRTLDASGDSEPIAGRHSTGRGVVISTQPPLPTFNYALDILSGILWSLELHCLRRDVGIFQPGSRIEEHDAV